MHSLILIRLRSVHQYYLTAMYTMTLGEMDRLPLCKITVTTHQISKKSDIFYPEGTINCNGEGNISLAEENSFKVNLSLPPGIYDYRIFQNQYYPVGRKMRRVVRYKGHFFSIRSRYVSAGLVMYFIYSSRPVKINLLREESAKVDVGRIRRKYGNIYYFVKEADKDFSLSIENETIHVGRSGPNFANNSGSRIIYQIFPDRFFRYDDKKKKKLTEWNSIPKFNSLYGGNLRGIIEKLDYLRAFNPEYIYINPIFKSHSNHRYDIDDYYKIDPILGRKGDFKELIDKAHENGIKIMMDMVFNHTSTYHRFFKDVLRNKRKSPYVDFYIFHSDLFKRFRLHCNFLKGKCALPSYETFMGYGILPKLNLRNEAVKAYLKEVMEHWVREFKIDGVRYDVGNSLPREFVKSLMSANRELLHIGEVWCASPIYALEGYYDGITNYFLRGLMLSLITKRVTVSQFIQSYYEFLFIYGRKTDNCMNLLSSHDIERIRTYFKGNMNAVLIAYTFLFMMNGYSLIYYGDEIGMEGGKDPDCRRTIPWGKINSRTLNFFKKLTELRRDNEIMKHGILTELNSVKINGISKISRNQRLNFYFGNDDAHIKIRGTILIGRRYIWKGRGKIALNNDGFVLELLNKN